MRRALLALLFLVACASAPAHRPSDVRKTAAGFDAELHPRLLDAIRAQKPFLLNGRGGHPPRVIINDEAMPTPLDVLNLIPTADVIRIERRIADPTQVGNVPTLRIWVRIGPERSVHRYYCDQLRAQGERSHRDWLRSCYLHEDSE